MRPTKHNLSPLNVRDKCLYSTLVLPEDDVRLGRRQKRITVHSSPVWYADESLGDLKPISTKLVKATDVKSGRSAYANDTNTIDFLLTDDGVVVYCLMGHYIRLTPYEFPGFTSAMTLEGEGCVKMEGPISACYEVQPGSIKETITINDSRISNVLWGWESDLTPNVKGDRIEWFLNGGLLFSMPAPTASDSAGKIVGCRYGMTSKQLSIELDEDDLRDAVYPVVIDPTVTTTQGDATYNRSAGEDEFTQFGLPCYEAYMLVALPDLTTELGTDDIVSAVWRGTPSALYNGGQGSILAYCDVVGPWNESSSAGTLSSLSFNGETSTYSGAQSVDTPMDIDILGDATKGIIKIYNDSPSGANATIKLVPDGEPLSLDVEASGVIVGTQTTQGGNVGTTFYPRTNGTYYWQVEIVLEDASSHTAVVATSLPQLTADLAAAVTHPSEVATDLPMVTADVAAQVIHKATIAAELHQLTAKIYIKPLVNPRADVGIGSPRIGDPVRQGIHSGRL